MIVGLKVEKQEYIVDWFNGVREKLKRYEGGGFLGKTYIAILEDEKNQIVVFRYDKPQHIIRPYWIGLLIGGFILLFGWDWWAWIVAGVFASFEFFLSRWLIYYSLALSLQKKTGIKKYSYVSAQDVADYLLRGFVDVTV